MAAALKNLLFLLLAVVVPSLRVANEVPSDLPVDDEAFYP